MSSPWAACGSIVRAHFVRLLMALAIVLAASAQALACGTCPACRLAEACNGPAPVGGYEVAQVMSEITGNGSAADPIQPGSWSMALMPDTQHYADNINNLPHFFNQTNWLADNLVSHNIEMVLHEGDITNNNNVTQWNNAKAALSVLDTGNVPYALAPGNHDYGTNGNSANRNTLFHNAEYFGPTSDYATQSSVGGFFEPGKTDNSWHTFNAGGNDWIVFTMEFGPRDEVVAWANDVLTDHSDKLAILVTHAYMYYDETIYDWATKGTSQNWNPHAYGVANLPGGVNDGQELWDDFVKLHENFRFVFNGHVLGDGTGYRATEGDNGNVVHQMLANYQMNTQGGQGDMRLLEFLADGETVNVRTYSPSLDRYDTSPDQQFTVNMNALPPAPPILYHAVSANLEAIGPTDPLNNANTVDDVLVTQTGDPPVGIGQLNRGDFQVTVGARGVSYAEGVLLASITQHDRPDFVNRQATVDVGRNSFGDGYLALSIMEGGNATKNEVNFNASTSWFSFEGGWKGAHVNGDGTLATGVVNGAPRDAFNGVDQSNVTRTNVGRYTVDLGANAQNDGMLFVIGNNNDNMVVQTGLLPGGTSWDVRVDDNATQFAATGEDKDWSFVYLPYDTPNLVGGHYNGNVNSNISAVGDFTMNRLATGQYELTVSGETPETGMLILSVASQITSGPTTAPDDNFLVYEPGAGGKFLINSYDITGVGSGTALQDTAFAWAFVGFENPISQVAPPPDLEFNVTVDRTTNTISLTNDGAANADIKGISILSSNGALAPATWDSIANNYDELPGDGSVDPDDPWTISSSTAFDLSESEESGGDGGTLAAGQTIQLGEVWKRSRLEDIVLEVELANGSVVLANVGYSGGPGGMAYHPSDLNTDGAITTDDWEFFYPNMLADLSSMSGVEKVLAGDIDGDGDNDLQDFLLFKADFESVLGSGSFNAMLTGVPEPSTFGLLLAAGAIVYAARRRSKQARGESALGMNVR
ncbi:MAG: metallophosphoesterase [Pirellulales bacterium]